jgi:hypothetical protein
VGDSLACLLFNVAPKEGIRATNIQIKSKIFHKSVQLFAYADDKDIIRRSEDTIRKTFIAVKIAVDVMGLRVEEKTKYMTVNDNKKHRAAAPYISISGYKFDRVHRFEYLGSLDNDTNDIREEISK